MTDFYRRNLRNVLMLTLSAALVLCFFATSVSAGLNSSEEIRVEVIFLKDGMGNDWEEQFMNGARQALPSDRPVSIAEVTVDRSLLADVIVSAVNEDFTAIVLPFGSESAPEAIRDANKGHVPVVCGIGDGFLGYSDIEAESFGFALTQHAVDCAAACRNEFSWGDDRDYTRRLNRVVYGMWEKEDGTRTRFMPGHVMSYEWKGSDNVVQVLKEVTSVVKIAELEEAVPDSGFCFDMSDGTGFKLYCSDMDVLESISENGSETGSLTRSADILPGRGDGNSGNYFEFGMIPNEQKSVYLTGKLSLFKGCSADGKTEECLALNLQTPVWLKSSDYWEDMIYSIQLTGFEDIEEDMLIFAERGTTVTIEGKLSEAAEENQYTPVVLNITSIEKQ